MVPWVRIRAAIAVFLGAACGPPAPRAETAADRVDDCEVLKRRVNAAYWTVSQSRDDDERAKTYDALAASLKRGLATTDGRALAAELATHARSMAELERGDRTYRVSEREMLEADERLSAARGALGARCTVLEGDCRALYDALPDWPKRTYEAEPELLEHIAKTTEAVPVRGADVRALVREEVKALRELAARVREVRTHQAAREARLQGGEQLVQRFEPICGRAAWKDLMP
jgi:hypothetical protein